MKRQLKQEELVASVECMVSHWPTWILRSLSLVIPKYYLQVGVKVVAIREDIDRRLREFDPEKN